MSDTEKATTDIADRLFAYGEQLAEKIAELGQQYGPQVVDLTLNVYRIQAIQNLAWGALGLALTITTIITMAATLKRLVPWVESDEHPFSPRAMAYAFWGMGGALIGIPSFIASLKLFSVWNWVGIWHPEVLMAKQVLGL